MLSSFLRVPSSLTCIWQQQIRTTFILKRRHQPFLSEVGEKRKRLRRKHYVYDLVEDTDCRPHENVSVILTDYVEGIGLKGAEVSVKKNIARYRLLLPGLAVYATDENRAKHKLTETELSSMAEHSSKTAEQTIRFLSKSVALLTMNMEQPWTIEQWHVKVAFRKGGIMVPEHAIKLPDTPISGPNLDLEGKCFLVTITINGLETVLVRCRIHHWLSNPGKRLPPVRGYWEAPLEPIFAGDEAILKTLPTPPGPKIAATF